MSAHKIYKYSMLLLSTVFFTLSNAQNTQTPSKSSEIDVQAINNKSAIPTYTNNPNLNNSKVLFKYDDSKTQITETKEYGHSQRDIRVNSSIGAYNLSKPLNGAVTDEKAQRNPSIQLMKF